MDIKAKDTSAPAGLNWRNKARRRYTPEQRLAMVQECVPFQAWTVAPASARSLLPWQGEVERRPLFDFRFGPDAPAVPLDHLVHDGQTPGRFLRIPWHCAACGKRQKALGCGACRIPRRCHG